MKRLIFKVLAVVIMVVSVAFMGTSIAAYYGRAEPAAEMIAPEMQDYTFERNPGENVTWSVTRRTGDKGSVGTFKTPYEALVKAHQDLVSRMNSSGSAASASLQELTGPLERFQTNQEQDRQAMGARITQLRQESGGYEIELLRKSEELQALSVQSRAIRDETADRRTDVVRLRNELEETRTDLFRLTEIRRVLTDRLVQLQLDVAALGDRRDQLTEQLRRD